MTAPNDGVAEARQVIWEKLYSWLGFADFGAVMHLVDAYGLACEARGEARGRADAGADTARLDWLERHDFSLMCWNVYGDPITREVAKPDNGWTIGLPAKHYNDESDTDDLAGETPRDCIDYARKEWEKRVRAARSGETQP